MAGAGPLPGLSELLGWSTQHLTEGADYLDSVADSSVTMRIVVDTGEGRPDVLDGGQKGVITMFPLKSGSGVIEIKPNWTWTPPWVNNYVPIN